MARSNFLTDERKPEEWTGEKPNYTQIPNALLDRGQGLSNAAFRVVCVVLRRTRGWHRQADLISLSQLEAQTGMSRKTVISAIDEALRLKWIARREVMTDRGASYVYEFRVAAEDSDDATSGNSALVEKLHWKEWKNSTATSGESTPLPVEKLHTQKKGKKTKKEKESSRAAGADATPSTSRLSMDVQVQQTASAPIPAATPTPEQPATQSIPDAPACEEPVRPERAPKSPLYGDCFVAVGKACVMDAKAPMSAKRISIAAKYLAQRGIDPAAVAGFAAWWSANDWRGKRGDKPTPERITELWVQYEEAQHSPKPATTTANVGGNANNNGKFRRAQVTFTDEQRRAIEEQARRALEEETNS